MPVKIIYHASLWVVGDSDLLGCNLGSAAIVSSCLLVEDRIILESIGWVDSKRLKELLK